MTETKRFIYYEEAGLFVGRLEEYPDYQPQGETMDQLRENLLDLHRELAWGEIMGCTLLRPSETSTILHNMHTYSSPTGKV